jgi:hypothetical protein
MNTRIMDTQMMTMRNGRTGVGGSRMPVILFFTAALWLLVGQEAQAQVGFAVEGRGGVTFPQGDLSDGGAEAGLSLGAEVQASFHRNVTAYVGIHRNSFNCDDGCTLGDDPRSTGIAAGLKYIFHSPGDILVWGRGGVVADKLESDSGSGDREIGFELGLGGDMPIAPRLYLVPNVGFTRYDAGGGFTASFFTLGIGLHYHIR